VSDFIDSKIFLFESLSSPVFSWQLAVGSPQSAVGLAQKWLAQQPRTLNTET
jgi:hypothetical protein